jgi:hypothetical protein
MAQDLLVLTSDAGQLAYRKLDRTFDNSTPTLATPKPWSPTNMPEKLIKIGAKLVSHGRYVTYQMAVIPVS